MFDSIRKHQRILQLVLLLLIFPAFAFFGVSGYDRFLSDGDSVASVGGSKITRQEFDAAMRQQLDRLRQVLGDKVDASMLDSPQARAEVLDGLVTQRVLLDASIQRRISVGDAKLRETIRAIPGLAKPDGSFDMERYRALLSAQGMNEPMFESQLRRDLAIQAMPEAVAASAIVPLAVLDRLIVLQEQTREVRELAFRASGYASRVSATDEQLRAYYAENAAAFEIPESARVEYLVLGTAAIAQRIALSADDVRSYYEQNAARYATPEERRASHVLIALEPGASAEARQAAQAKAQDIVRQARAGADFAALARANSQDPGSAGNGGDLGWFRRDTMVKPFADAAFALAEGAVGDVVETEFGLHVIKLTGIKPGAARRFEEVRAEIESELRLQQAGRKYAETADAFSNTVYEQSDSLKPAAERFGLEIRTAESLTRSGAGVPADSPLANQRLLAALFSPESIQSRRNTDAIEVGGNTLVSARIVEHRPAGRKPFEDVRDQVRGLFVATQAARLAREAGAAKLAELRGGASASGFAEPRTVSRAAADAVPVAALEAVFKAPSDKLPAFAGVDLGQQGYSIYQIVRVTDPPPDRVAQRRDEYRQQIARLYGQQQTADLVDTLKSRAKITTRLSQLEPNAEGR